MISRLWRIITGWLGHSRWPLVAAGLAIAVTIPSLWTGLVVDDYVHRAMLLRLPGFATEPASEKALAPPEKSAVDPSSAAA